MLKKGANPNGKNQFGRTALIQAITNNDLKSAKILVEHKADIELDDGKFTPLASAVQGNKLEIAKYLLEKGADPNGKGNPLLLAKQGDNKTLVTILTNAGAK